MSSTASLGGERGAGDDGEVQEVVVMAAVGCGTIEEKRWMDEWLVDCLVGWMLGSKWPGTAVGRSVGRIGSNSAVAAVFGSFRAV